MDMASEEIEMENIAQTSSTEITEDSASGNISCWVVELEDELEKKVKTSRRSSPVVFSVAKVLSASYQQFYIPRLISFGPYYFGRPELSSMEPHKTEAVRRMQERIDGPTMKSIVATNIVGMDKSIREFYDKELPYSPIDLAWMITKDSCFLFEFMLNYLRTYPGKQDFHNDCVVEGRYDAVLSSSPMNPTWKTIASDLALFENQIPLSVLQFLLTIANPQSHPEKFPDTDAKNDPEKILGDILNSVSKLNTNMVFEWGMARPYDKAKTFHFLEVSYYRHVGWDLECYEQKACFVKNQRLFHLGWVKSIFTSRGVENHDDVPLSDVKLQTATELKKKGVNFCAITSPNITGPPQGIRWVRFEEETSTLYLPQVRIDLSRHALLRNFIALENTSEKYTPAPITSFAFFMDELVDSEEDVAVLKEANIIKNFFGSNKEAAKCFNALTMRDHVPAGCKPIDDARVGLHKYLQKNYKLLWNEFISTYFAKPWLVVGTVAATLFLLMTVLQVFCLFYVCNRST